jgi:hypothetical protein
MPRLVPLLLALLLAVAACSPSPVHRFTDVADARASPDGRAVAALVWDEHGPKAPHVSALVVVPRGTDPRDGAPVILTSDDFHPIDYAWAGPAALTLRLPCGRWSHLANHAIVAGRTVTIAHEPARGCYVGPAGTGALPGPGL